MLKMKNMMFLMAVVLLAGCVTDTSVTNLTPTRAKRTPNNLYLIEYEWRSNQQSMRADSISPTVVVGTDMYPMRRIPRMKNRWEAYIPVSPSQKSVMYHIKVDYEYNDFGKRG
ncbi:MAG TPA: hypothetical protein VJ063_01405, partial [Verrucomicrobiae bacterium]|nr:hypothetical protein [Verrucomicrobiae bacterium]